MSTGHTSKLFLEHEEAMAVARYLMTSKAVIEYERLPTGQLRITIDQHGAALLKEKSKPSYVYVQEGGSTLELYLHEHATQMSALAGRVSCASVGAYKTGAIVEISPCLQSLGNVFYATAEAIVRTVPALTFYGKGEAAASDDFSRFMR